METFLDIINSILLLWTRVQRIIEDTPTDTSQNGGGSTAYIIEDTPTDTSQNGGGD